MSRSAAFGMLGFVVLAMPMALVGEPAVGEEVEKRATCRVAAPQTQHLRSRCLFYAHPAWVATQRVLGLKFPKGAPATVRPAHVAVWSQWGPPDGSTPQAPWAASSESPPYFCRTCEAAQAVRLPALAPNWTAARVFEGRMEIGYPLPDGGMQPVSWGNLYAGIGSANGKGSEFRTGFATLCCAPPEEWILPLLASSARTWSTGSVVTDAVTLSRGPGIEALEGELELRCRTSTPSEVVLDFRYALDGVMSVDGARRLDRTVRGQCTVNAEGLLLNGKAKVETRVTHLPSAEAGLNRAWVEVCSHKQPEADEPDADVFGQLTLLDREDPDACSLEILRSTMSMAALRLAGLGMNVDVGTLSEGILTDLPSGGETPSAGQTFEPTLTTVGALYAMAFPAVVSLLGAPWSTKEQYFNAGKIEIRAAGAAYTEERKIWVKPGSCQDLRVVAHELAHVAQSNLYRRCAARFRFPEAAELETGWFDADAALAVLVCEEAAAEITAQRSLFDVTGGPVDALVVQSVSRELEAWPEARDLTEWLMWIAYGQGPAWIASKHSSAMGLSATLHDVRKTMSGQTREILFPDLKSKPSDLFVKARENRGAVPHLRGTRVGSFGVALALLPDCFADARTPERFAAALEDDVLLYSEGGAAWVLHFADAACAEGFLSVCRSWKAGDQSSRLCGRYVVLITGSPKLPRGWLQSLDPGLRMPDGDAPGD